VNASNEEIEADPIQDLAEFAVPRVVRKKIDLGSEKNPDPRKSGRRPTDFIGVFVDAINGNDPVHFGNFGMEDEVVADSNGIETVRRGGLDHFVDSGRSVTPSRMAMIGGFSVLPHPDTSIPSSAMNGYSSRITISRRAEAVSPGFRTRNE
jgi:hypothetical protein